MVDETDLLVADEEWTVERPEPENHEWDPDEDGEDDSESEAEVEPEPNVPPDAGPDAPPNTDDGPEATKDEAVPTAPVHSETPGAANDPASAGGPEPAAAEPAAGELAAAEERVEAEAAVNPTADDDFEKSWDLGEALPPDAPPEEEEPAPEPEEELASDALGEYRALREDDVESDAGSLASWAYSVEPTGADIDDEAVREGDGIAPPADEALDAQADYQAPTEEALEAAQPLLSPNEHDEHITLGDEATGADDDASEISWHAVPGPQDRFIIDPAERPELSAPAAAPRRAAEVRPQAIKRIAVPEPPKYGAAALTDERSHPYLNELPTLRAQLRSIGPLGEQLYALASRQAAAARRTQKHTPHAQRGTVGEAEWWNCLLESLGLPEVPPVGPGSRALGGAAMGAAPR